MTIPYTEGESDAASKRWKARCGHHSIAAACGVSLDEVKRACPRLCGWMNPTMVEQSLQSLGRGFKLHKTMDNDSLALASGAMSVARIQFLGPWMGKSVADEYKHTHYVAIDGCQIEVMDPMIDPCFIVDGDRWYNHYNEIVKDCVRKATGWKFTHLWLLA
jgi:hypothetical protein